MTLHVRDLNFSYDKRHPVLRDVSFDVPGGAFMAILGTNGAGKSTLLKCLNKILTPSTGTVTFNGTSLLDLSLREIARRVTYVDQNVPRTELTVHDVVMLGRRPFMSWRFNEADHDLVHEAMDRMGVTHLRGRYLSELSGGERQKTMLARALVQEPELLLLDEPTSALDLKNQYEVLDIIRGICAEQQVTAVMVIHNVDLALRFCDQILLLSDQTVYRCGGRETVDRQALFDVYEVDGEIVEVRGVPMLIVD